MAKFSIKCLQCRSDIGGFEEWFSAYQRCPKCGSGRADVLYANGGRFVDDVKNRTFGSGSIWKYFDMLPLENEDNIVSTGEGHVTIDRWRFLEKAIERTHAIRCKVYAHRHDNNFATGTFKDLAGSVVASVLKENGIDKYVVASTGNIGVAYARYLTDANISLFAFIPKNSNKSQEAEISCFGQRVFRVNGDYTKAKELARAFAEKNGIQLAAGNYDPMRVEAKKTMVYDWIQQMPEYPSVYIQALSGGTGPIGIEKACRELPTKMPRMVLVQSGNCAPMAEAWASAKAGGFPDGWENDYPIYNNPQTSIPTLATGYPRTYPVVSDIVKRSEGEIISFPEEWTVHIARYVAYQCAVRMGPAAAVAVGGFLTSVRDSHVRDGDVVLLNIGEGIRRSPSFMEKLMFKNDPIDSIDDCALFNRDSYKSELWHNILDIMNNHNL